MNIAIIPARGGSKRIPRKNIKPFAGKPMIAYAIEAAQKSAIFDVIYVSTDDAEIATIAQALGAEIIHRPAELADDHTPTNPVIVHAIHEVERQLVQTVDHVACIYPCVPFIQVEDMLKAKALLQSTEKAEVVFPVTEFHSPVQRALRQSSEGVMSSMYPENVLKRSQDLEKAYYDVGQFYLGTKNAWLSGQSAHQGGIGLVIPHWRVVDVDTPDDWVRAELIYETLCRRDSKE